MKNVVLTILIIVYTLSSWMYTRNLREQILLQEDMIQSLQLELETNFTLSGGGEIYPEQFSITEFEEGFKYLFPIAKSDFLFYTSPYGLRVSPILNVEMVHQGIDIAATWRAQVIAVADGVVIDHWPPPDHYYRGHPVFGGYVVLRHLDESESRYAHLSWTRVHQGEQIKTGEIIGRIGNTGMSDGPHLHFELLINDENVNPLLYLPNLEETSNE